MQLAGRLHDPRPAARHRTAARTRPRRLDPGLRPSHRHRLPHQGRREFLARLVRLPGSSPGLAIFIVFRLALARSCDAGRGEGLLERRAVIVGGGEPAEELIRGAGGPARQRHPHLRHLRRPQRRPLAADRRRLSEARHGRRTGRVRPHRADRPADRRPAAHRREPPAAAFSSSCGCCRSISAFGAHQQAALPPARLFLRRQRPVPRRLRQADRRLGRRRQAALRPCRRRR